MIYRKSHLDGPPEYHPASLGVHKSLNGMRKLQVGYNHPTPSRGEIEDVDRAQPWVSLRLPVSIEIRAVLCPYSFFSSSSSLVPSFLGIANEIWQTVLWESMAEQEAGSSKFKAKCLTLPASPCGHGLWTSHVLGFCKPGILHPKLWEIQECAMPKILQ